jgi:hypothetical protein
MYSFVTRQRKFPMIGVITRNKNYEIQGGALEYCASTG